MQRRKKQLKQAGVFLLVIVLAMIWLMPLYWLVRSSFMGIEDMFKNPPIWIPKKLRFENYRSALTALPFVKYFSIPLPLWCSACLGSSLAVL